MARILQRLPPIDEWFSREEQTAELIFPPDGFEALGPVQVLVKGPACPILEAFLEDGRHRVPGVVRGRVCSFLILPRESRCHRFTAHLLLENGSKIQRTWYRRISLTPLLDPEPPYAFLHARRQGLVLDRSHIYGSGPPNELPHELTLQKIMEFAGDSILDVGCGIGAYMKALGERGFMVVGVETCREYASEATSRGLRAVYYDGFKLPFGDGSFDTVVAVEILEHVPQWWELLQEMLRVARRRILITTPNIGVLGAMGRHGVVPWHILESTHVNFFFPESWQMVALRLPGVAGFVETYAPLVVNGESFDQHIFVVLQKHERDVFDAVT